MKLLLRLRHMATEENLQEKILLKVGSKCIFLQAYIELTVISQQRS